MKIKLAAIMCCWGVLLAQSTLAQAPPRRDALQVSEQADAFVLTVPVSRLSMTLPKGGFTQRGMNIGGSTSNPRYFYFEDASRALIVSGWFEPASGFRGMDDFWKSETNEWKRRAMPAPRDVVFERVGTWDVVFYEVAIPRGTNSHVRAHWVEAGTWIDVHFSVTSNRSSAESRELLRGLLKSVEVRQK